MADYIPSGDNDKVSWFGNYSSKAGQYASQLGLNAAQITQTTQDYAMFKYAMDCLASVDAYSQQWTKFKNLVRGGTSTSSVPLPLPLPPVFAAAPTLVTEGVFTRVRKQVRTIKASSGYTEGIGKALGVIGDDPVSDFEAMKPELKLQVLGGKVKVNWKKGKASSINIYIDRGDGKSVFFANDAQPDFVDNTPLPDEATTWRYRAIYVLGDEEVGLFSDEVAIMVKKFM